MIKIFFSYSHKDEAMRNELGKHLSILKRNKLIDAWNDHRIEAGSDFSSVIDANLKKANIILLLVSSDFLDSDYCYNIEMGEAMLKYERGEASVIPIIVRHCAWKDAPFGKLKALPTDGKPVSSFLNKDEAFLDIVEGIKLKMESLKVTKEEKAFVEPIAKISDRNVHGPRSTNLRISKVFHEQEKDKFLSDTMNHCM